jgi:hypothetical protein
MSREKIDSTVVRGPINSFHYSPREDEMVEDVLSRMSK